MSYEDQRNRSLNNRDIESQGHSTINTSMNVGGLTRQTSYQRMLQKYNEKKDKLIQPIRPALPAAPNGGIRLNSARGNTSTTQPQYLQYLEKTLEKSDQTIQNVKMLSQQFKVLEQRQDQFDYAQEDIYTKFKVIEEMTLAYGEENALTKLMLDSFQQKQREIEVTVATLTRMQGVPQEHNVQDNQYAVHQALQNMEVRLENMVHQKMQENSGNMTMVSGWAIREKKLMDIIDNQGKDIAIDFAKMETQIAEIQNQMKMQIQQQIQMPVYQPQPPQYQQQTQQPLQQQPEQPHILENPENDSRISDIYHKLNELETHLVIYTKQQKLDRISRSRSKSQTRNSNPAELEAMEKRLQGVFTNKLAKTVEQMGQIIKKQELRLIKLHKSFKEYKAKNSNKAPETKPHLEALEPVKDQPKPIKDQPKPIKLVEKRVIKPTRLREPGYKSFSPVLSSTSKSVRNLMQTIQEEAATLKPRKSSKIERGRSMSALKNEIIVNGKLQKKAQIARVKTPIQKRSVSKRSVSKNSKNSKNNFQKQSQMSHMSTRSRQILEKMKLREQRMPKNHTESSELVINERYNPLRYKPETRSHNSSIGKKSSHKSSLLLSASRLLGSQGSPYKQHREQQQQEKPRSVEDKTSSQSSPFQRSNLRESYLSKAYRSRSRSNKKQQRVEEPQLSNQREFQVVRDQKGIQRKIEYKDEDSLQYSKSVFKQEKKGTPQFEENGVLTINQLSPIDSTPGKLQVSATSALDRSQQLRVTNDRLAKLEQMYAQLSYLEAETKN